VAFDTERSFNIPARRGNETILIVEDEPTLRDVTADMLSSAGYRVLQASSGVDALRVWFAEDEKIDLLFSDIVMPEGMSGRKLAEKFIQRKHGRLRRGSLVHQFL